MKTFYYLSTILRSAIRSSFLILFMSIWLLAQSSDRSGVNHNDVKSPVTKVNENKTSVSDQKTEVRTGSGIKILLSNKLEIEKTTKITAQKNDNGAVKVISSDCIDGDNPIEVTMAVGESKTQVLTIKNSEDSPLIWNIAPEGSEKLLFRLYRKDRDLFELSVAAGKEINDAVTYTVYNAKETLSEMAELKNTVSKSKIPSAETDFNSQKKQTTSDDFLNILDNNTTSKISDKANISIKQENLKTEISNNDFINNENDNNSPGVSNYIDFSRKLDIDQEKENTAFFRNQIQIFRQWYQFAECGYPTFKPRIDVWEVSSDNGDHWQQIFSLNGESFVVNAQCFDPVEFLESYSFDGQKVWTSELTTLQEFAKQVQSGPSPYPSSGIIPANTSADIKLGVDATSLEKGTYNPKLVLTDAASLETIEVVPLRLNVTPESEKEDVNKLAKEMVGEQLPDKYELFQNYPNPFNPSTRISYSILADGLVTLKVYDVLGSEVATLVNENKQAGFYEVEFNASSLANGVYFYRLQAGDFVETKKMMLLK